MNMPTQIPLAEFKTIYSLADVERAMEDSCSKGNETLQAMYKGMKKSGGVRFIVKPSSTSGLDDLYESSPNFSEVIDALKRHMALAIDGNEPMQFTPMLLLGEPGLGKTHFAKNMAKVLGTSFEFLSMSSLTAGWILSGASSQWSNAKPGKVAHALINGDFANPLITLDELDKAGGDSRYDPMGSLYGLLEHDTALHFKDEFVEVNIDASNILWVATANNESNIPDPILNRMDVYVIERPDHDGSIKIALSIYRDILEQHKWGFDVEPSNDVLDCLAEDAPRNMRKVLVDAFGNAKLGKRDHLLPEDLNNRKTSSGKKKKIGFC
ncbi:MAG: AAA family ATPase [Candidatus Nitrotoga sp.]